MATIPGQYTAVGNIVAANDNGAIASPFLSPEAVEVIEETLDVDVKTSHIVGSDIIGSLIKVTNKGFLMSTNALQSEVNFAREVFGVASRRADWTFAGERLISSASTKLANTGPFLIWNCSVF